MRYDFRLKKTVLQEYSFQITMRQAWVDQRLQYENILNQREDLKSEQKMKTNKNTKAKTKTKTKTEGRP